MQNAIHTIGKGVYCPIRLTRETQILESYSEFVRSQSATTRFALFKPLIDLCLDTTSARFINRTAASMGP